MMKITALIPAAGKGERINQREKKQFLNLNGKPILAHTLSIFNGCPKINEIILVVPGDNLEECNGSIVKRYNFNKVTWIVPGGQSRQESVRLGLDVTPDDSQLVVIHDGVRPFVSVDLIDKSVEEANRYGAVVVAIPISDTLKRVTHKQVDVTLDREGIWQVQTPQAFRYPLIKEAHKRAQKEGFKGTDDAALVERIGHMVRVLMGSPRNVKITTPEDLSLAEAICLLKSR